MFFRCSRDFFSESLKTTLAECYNRSAPSNFVTFTQHNVTTLRTRSNATSAARVLRTGDPDTPSQRDLDTRAAIDPCSAT